MWRVRQHQVILAILRMYCGNLPAEDFPPSLRQHMIIEGAVAAATQRQDLAKSVAEADLGVVLDVATVQEGPWLGTLMQTAGHQPRCDQTSSARSSSAH
jgi:hypothetical protein